MTVININLTRTHHFWIIAILLDFLIVLFNSTFIDISSWFPWSQEIMAASGVTLLVFNFLFIIPIVYASIVFGLRGTIFTWLIFLIGILPRSITETQNLGEAVGYGLFALTSLLLGLLVSFSLHWARQAREMKKRNIPRRWSSVGRILKAQEGERERIAQELHDSTIQDLLVLVNHVHAIETGSHGDISPEVKRKIEQLENEMLHVIDNVRRMSHGLRSSVLDNTGLIPAIRWLAESISQESNIKVQVIVHGKEHKIRPEAETLIFRITQEALSNVREHSGATEASISLDFDARDFKLTIRDNGTGFTVPDEIYKETSTSTSSQLGLDIIKQRTRLLGGKLTLLSEPGRGTTIIVEAQTSMLSSLTAGS